MGDKTHPQLDHPVPKDVQSQRNCLNKYWWQQLQIFTTRSVSSSEFVVYVQDVISCEEVCTMFLLHPHAKVVERWCPVPVFWLTQLNMHVTLSMFMYLLMPSTRYWMAWYPCSSSSLRWYSSFCIPYFFSLMIFTVLQPRKRLFPFLDALTFGYMRTWFWLLLWCCKSFFRELGWRSQTI